MNGMGGEGTLSILFLGRSLRIAGLKNGTGNSEGVSLVQVRGGDSVQEGNGLGLKRRVWICKGSLEKMKTSDSVMIPMFLA